MHPVYQSRVLFIMRKKIFSRFYLQDVLHEVGLYKCPGCYLDSRFIIALFAGALLLAIIYPLLPVFSRTSVFQWMTMLSLVVWQPFIEELLFRGVIQGQLSRRQIVRKCILHISLANFVTSALFTALHLFTVSTVVALLVFIPSLVFGYLRDTYGSIFPSILLHAVYNLYVVLALLMAGQAIILKPVFQPASAIRTGHHGDLLNW
jgi:membrane protease YdiL (CAAX protease family)